MAEIGATDRDRRAREYLKVARLLIIELDRAMLAISGNGLSQLEESLNEQEVLIAGMRHLQEELWGEKERVCVIAQATLDGDLAKEIVGTHIELLDANRIYEIVVRSSSHSASLMRSLLDSLKGQFQEASGPRLKYQTWSCQV